MYCITLKRQQAIRGELVAAYRSGRSVTQISADFRVARSTVYRWIRRESTQSLSFAPRYQPRKVSPLVEEQVRQARVQTGRGPWFIGLRLNMPTSTVYKILCRLGINRLAPAQPPQPVHRYEYKHPGDMVHVDVKKLGTKGLERKPRSIRRHLGYECLHVMLDDHSRYVFAVIYPDETAASAAEFLERGVAHFAGLGVAVQRVLSDNAASYVSQQWRDTCQLLNVRPVRTRPRHPQTNGKCERWNRTLMDEALPGPFLPSLQARAAVIDNFVNQYNTRRPHKALNGKTPLRRLVTCSGPV